MSDEPKQRIRTNVWVSESEMRFLLSAEESRWRSVEDWPGEVVAPSQPDLGVWLEHLPSLVGSQSRAMVHLPPPWRPPISCRHRMRADQKFQGVLSQHKVVGGLKFVAGKRAENGAWFGDVLEEEFVGEVC